MSVANFMATCQLIYVHQLTQRKPSKAHTNGDYLGFKSGMRDSSIRYSY